MNEANPATHDRIVLLIFWAVPAFISVRRLAGGRCGPTLPRYRGRVKNLSAAVRFPSEDDVEASAASVPPMRTPHCCNVDRMARRREPIVHRGPDCPAAKRRLAGALVTGDEQDDALAFAYRSLQRAIDCAPGAVEAHPVKVDDPIGLDVAAAK